MWMKSISIYPLILFEQVYISVITYKLGLITSGATNALFEKEYKFLSNPSSTLLFFCLPHSKFTKCSIKV